MSDVTRQASDQLTDLVTRFEGFQRQVVVGTELHAYPYLCPARFWTIGYGHLCNQDSLPITQTQGRVILAQDLIVARVGVLKFTNWQLNDNQLDALTSFVFNLGVGRYRASSMRSQINRGELGNVPTELRKWVYGGGRVLPGLVLRRSAEAVLWAKK